MMKESMNLLPWRELFRARQKKQFWSVLALASVISLGIIAVIKAYTWNLLMVQNERNNRLQKEINMQHDILKEIKTLRALRDVLISRMIIVNNMQSTRIILVHLFDEIIKILPANSVIFKLERINDQVTLWGYAKSNAIISILMKNIEFNAWIQNPVLTEIKKMEDMGFQNYQFKLSFILKKKRRLSPYYEH